MREKICQLEAEKKALEEQRLMNLEQLRKENNEALQNFKA